jgi:hypothetical protein
VKLLLIVRAEKSVNGLVLPAVSRPTARRTATISCPGELAYKCLRRAKLLWRRGPARRAAIATIVRAIPRPGNEPRKRRQNGWDLDRKLRFVIAQQSAPQCWESDPRNQSRPAVTRPYESPLCPESDRKRPRCNAWHHAKSTPALRRLRPPRGCLRRPPDVILVEKAILDLDIDFVEPLFGSAHCNAEQLVKLDAFSATLPQQGRWRYRLLFELLHRALFRLLV